MNATGRNSFGMDDEGGQNCAPRRAMSRLAKAFVLFVSLMGLGTWGGMRRRRSEPALQQALHGLGGAPIELVTHC